MFHSRRSSQKPDEEFYSAFKQNFANLAPWHPSVGHGPSQRPSSLSEALIDTNTPLRLASDVEDSKDEDAILKGGVQDGYRFTPSVMDPNSVAFSAIANQPPGYYTPVTSGGVNTLYHSQAGDLHTPGMGMSIGTPLSLPQTAHCLSNANPNVSMSHYHPQMMQAHQYDNMSAYVPLQGFAPTSFLQHQDSGYEAMSHSSRESPTQKDLAQADGSMVAPLAEVPSSREVDGGLVAASSNPARAGFRYQCTLNAPTAMIKHSDEIPISYLNKGQAYTLSIVDTLPSGPSFPSARYRTHIRISFEDEEQRSKPGACWQLWKEGRGTSEAHQRDGKLLAVEYVDTSQGGDEESRKDQIGLEHNSFDGFCVTWSPNPINGRPECSVSVRFNFLSTDFSHSKGVKGIPVRLCAKTHTIPSTFSVDLSENCPEVCYAKVKLFRDHGAERKLANDVAHVRKAIEKFKQQISQAESGLLSCGRRRQSGSMAKPHAKGSGRMLAKDKRAWSMDSDGDNPMNSMTLEEDSVMKLATMQDMFSSTRPISVLYLRGSPEDDADLFPIQLSADQQDAASPDRQERMDAKPSIAGTPTASNVVSPTSTSNTVIFPHSPKPVFVAPSVPPPHASLSPRGFAQYGSGDALCLSSATPHSRADSVTQPKIGARGKAIDVVGVDADYQAAPESPARPAACFYVRQKDCRDPYYRAIYLMHRTVNDLVRAISEKFQVGPLTVCRVTHLTSTGLCIVVDEEVVRELREEQDMIVEFSKTSLEQPIKSEYPGSDSHDVMFDSDLGSLDPLYNDGLEMWLNY